MNSYLLHLVGKWISLLMVSISSLFGTYNLNTRELLKINNDANKGLNIVYTIVKHEVVVKKTNRLPLNASRLVTKGEDGIIYINKETEETETIREVITEVVEKGIGPQGQYKGRLTAYGPDCATCSGKGNVACSLPKGTKFNLIKDGITYDDKEYGEVRVLAAAHKIFRCGTIIRVTPPSKKAFIGIILDTGGALIREWDKERKIIIDLAFSTEKDPEVKKVTSNNVKYDVLRWGW